MGCCQECHKQGKSYIGCHSKCEEYIKECEEREKRKKELLEKIKVADTCYELEMNRKRTKSNVKWR